MELRSVVNYEIAKCSDHLTIALVGVDLVLVVQAEILGNLLVEKLTFGGGNFVMI